VVPKRMRKEAVELPRFRCQDAGGLKLRLTVGFSPTFEEGTMEKTIRKRPAADLPRENKPREEMSVILRNTPPGYNWGWFSREDQRMHLQTVDKKHRNSHYKVWLENKGRRVVEPEPGIPAKVLKALLAAIRDERKRIDAEWAAFMIKRGWLEAQLVGPTIILSAYPRSPNRFERTLELRELIPNESCAQKVTAKDVALNEEFAFLELFPQRDEGARMHEPLERILWLD
jgi:hypothetical protein